MKIHDRLSKEELRQLNRLKKEQLSNHDIKELMGINRDTYKKQNGAWRRK